MRVSVTWHNPEQTIIYVHFESGWAWSDFWQMNEAFVQLANTVKHQVALIVDLTDAGMPSLFAHQFRDIANTSKSERPANLDYTVVVGITGLLEIAINIFNKLYGHTSQHVVFAATLAEAEQIIAARNQPSN